MPPQTTTQQLTFLSDPGHGWLRVPLVDIALSGSADSISRYSFIDINNSVAYLEEDCDVARYLEALDSTGISRPQITTEYSAHFDRSRFARFGDACFDATFWENHASCQR
jgi:hypothetical protein